MVLEATADTCDKLDVRCDMSHLNQFRFLLSTQIPTETALLYRAVFESQDYCWVRYVCAVHARSLSWVRLSCLFLLTCLPLNSQLVMFAISFACMQKNAVMSEKKKRLVAYHEAGHALVGALMPEYDPVTKISIVPRGAAGGLTFFAPDESRLESGLYSRTVCFLLFSLPSAVLSCVVPACWRCICSRFLVLRIEVLVVFSNTKHC